jgi:predicted branched-subunit amino acid permease
MKRHDFWHGFKAVLPFWIGAAPFALTYVLAARGAGLGTTEIAGMSLLIDSAATQMSLVQMIDADVPAVIVLLTVAAMNLHLVLYGISLAKQIAFSPLQRFAAAFPLTDGAYGVAVNEGGSFSFLMGASLGIYAAWNLFTLVGCAVGDSLVSLVGADLDFVIPLTFSMLLVSAIKTRPDLYAALVAALITVVCATAKFGSLTTLMVSVSGLLFGIGWMQRLKAAPQ